MFRFTLPATMPAESPVSVTEKASRSPAKPLSGVNMSKFLHGVSENTYPSSATERNGRFKMIGRLCDWLAGPPIVFAIGNPVVAEEDA